MIDIVFPDNNEAEFLAVGERLGFSSLLFVYRDKDLVPQTVKRCAVLCDPRKIQSVRHLAFCRGSAAAREAVECSAALVFGVEDERKDSLHFRRSGLDQVLCRLMHRNGVKLGFAFSDILKNKGMRRAILLGRMMQNIVFCRKFKVSMVVGSFADDPMKMRSPRSLQAFFRTLGMTHQEAAAALTAFK